MSGSRYITTNPEQLRKIVRRCMRKLLMKAADTDDGSEQAQKEIDFAWALVDWRTFDPASPMQAFPGTVALIFCDISWPATVEGCVLRANLCCR